MLYIGVHISTGQIDNGQVEPTSCSILCAAVSGKLCDVHVVTLLLNVLAALAGNSPTRRAFTGATKGNQCHAKCCVADAAGGSRSVPS